ncbi:endo-1,4-beta-xylanase 5-like [Magnolia sinica]|uniref:endo-1,4-beta-xylanase 5-like n=1 Tax=Magnolia sinica TaxID=86752 RepID=UPI00265B11F9|nr:endo-1,4-beta-xylanase 5-like [Magnolia sinica]
MAPLWVSRFGDFTSKDGEFRAKMYSLDAILSSLRRYFFPDSLTRVELSIRAMGGHLGLSLRLYTTIIQQQLRQAFFFGSDVDTLFHFLPAVLVVALASYMCLEEPLKPQYGGGILINPQFNHGLKGWSRFGLAQIEERVSKGGNRFIVAHSRNQSDDSVSQKLYLYKDRLYTFSAWIQVSEGNVPVNAVFKTATGLTDAGTIIAKAGCWSMIKGGFTVDVSGPAELYFDSKYTKVDIWVDSVSLQPFTKAQWRAHQEESIQKVRKRKARFHALDTDGNSLPGAMLSVKQNKASFPLGCAINSNILNYAAYQNWFASRFAVTVFDNEMKWYSTEKSPGKEDYSVPDAMVAFAKRNGISVRGHTIHWDNPSEQPYWVNALSPDQLKVAAFRRLNSVVSRYAGQLIGWDINNENLHFSFYEDKFGQNATAAFFQRAHQLDPNKIMFMNEFNTIEYKGDSKASPAQYLEKLREIMAYPGNQGPTAIGLEGHFDVPNIPYMRSAIDILASAKLPIWLTEVDAAKDPKQAQYLEEILREGHAHPAVQGIIVWAGWSPGRCNKLCLTDDNFKNLPTGDVVDKLINEWKSSNVVGITDHNGFFEVPLFHGDYDVTITHPSKNTSMIQTMKVTPQSLEEETIYVKVYA